VPAEGGSSAEGEEPTPSAWLTDTDAAYGFSVEYPNTYTILPEPTTLPESKPQVIHEVRFLDKALAASDLAALEPPNFAIAVFEMGKPMTLRDWLSAEGGVPQDASVEPVHLQGAGDGWKVTLMVQMAPNEFYYVAAGKYVFELTPLGPYGDRMLATFQVQAK